MWIFRHVKYSLLLFLLLIFPRGAFAFDFNLDEILKSSFILLGEKTAPMILPFIPAGYDDEETLINFCRSSIENGGSLEEKLSACPAAIERRVCLASLASRSNLETRLRYCPRLSSQILWEETDGRKISYPHWPEEKKERLEEIFGRILRNERDLGIRCPVLNERNLNSNSLDFYLSQAEAFDIYAAHLANSLNVEASHRVPWSMLDNPPEENKVILDSAYYHSRIAFSGMGRPASFEFYPPETSYQNFPSQSYPTISCDPRVALRFLTGENSSLHENLMGENPLETLQNLSWFLYKNAWHTHQRPDVWPSLEELNRFYFQLSNRLQDRSTLNADGSTTHGLEQRTGCHSASALLIDLARSINLPLLPVWTYLSNIPVYPFSASQGQHAGLVYHWTQRDALFLVHLDDLYVQVKPFFPVDEAGSPIREENLLKQILFSNTWLPPPELERWGFHFFTAYPLITSGTWYPALPGSLRPHLAHIGGYWERRLGMIDVGSISFFVNREYKQSPWASYLELYCDPQRFGTYSLLYAQMISVIHSFGDLRPLIPSLHSPEDYENKAAESVRAYGGCDSLRSLVHTFERNLGLNHLE